MISRRRFFGQAFSAAAFASVAGCVPDSIGSRPGASAADAGAGAVAAPQKPLLKVGLLADVHILVAKDRKMQSREVFEKALRYFDEMKADAVLLAGDIADCGLIAELECAAEIWRKVFPEGKRSDGEPIEQLFALGDHDLGGFAQKYPWAAKHSADPDAVNHPICDADVPAVWKGIFGEDWSPVQIKTVKGYNFVLAHFPIKGGGGTGDVPNPGLAEALAKADADPAKPFFYTQHRPVYGTLPEMNPADLEKSVNHKALTAHPNVLAFFGHCHRNCADELNLWQGAYTAVHLPSTNYCGTRWGRENSFSVGNQPSKPRPQQMQRVDVDRSRQLMFMDVYADRIVLARRDIANDAPMGPDWIVPLPSPDGSCSSAARAEKALAPQFRPKAWVKAKSGRGKNRAQKVVDQVVVYFPVAPSRNGMPRAFDYEVTATAEGFGPLVRRVFPTRAYWAEDFDKEYVRCKFGRDELPEGKPVSFTVRPANCYRQHGEAIGPAVFDGVWSDDAAEVDV